eukprot:949780-Prymnesium_polylepis.1
MTAPRRIPALRDGDGAHAFVARAAPGNARVCGRRRVRRLRLDIAGRTALYTARTAGRSVMRERPGSMLQLLRPHQHKAFDVNDTGQRTQPGGALCTRCPGCQPTCRASRPTLRSNEQSRSRCGSQAVVGA